MNKGMEIMTKKYTIRQAIDVATKYTHKGRLADVLGYGDKNYWKKNLGSYDKGRKKEFVVTKRKIDGKNHMIISNVKNGHDYLWYRTNYEFRRKK